jgi:hypothetical protein
MSTALHRDARNGNGDSHREDRKGRNSEWIRERCAILLLEGPFIEFLVLFC